MDRTIEVPLMTGRFWFSKKQRRMLSKRGQRRMFCRIGGEKREYTEMAVTETMAYNPRYWPLVDDAELLGDGFFSHFEDL